MRIPGAVLRLQRRDSYRTQLPMGKPIKAYLQPFAEHPDRLHEARLVDISCGGLAMILTTVDFPIEIGQVYPACSINLPGVGTVSAPLEITYVSDVALNNGTSQRRAGCRFINLPGPMQSMIQRYINQAERERHLMRR
jgi:c-di-GMP-binding flagellar brake protein YcgR